MAALLSHRAQDIYPSLMLSQGHGYPLWHPEPPSNFPPDYVRRGTQVGDLGYLNDAGGFMYLFNVYKDAEDLVNLKRVPPGFAPPNSDPGIREDVQFHDENSVIAMSGVEQRSAGAFLKFTSISTQGAVLILPDGAERYDSEHPGLLREYAAANAHSWYDYLNSQGMEIRNGMLYLVTGCDKCCSWATKCCMRSSNTSKFVLSRAIQEIQTVSGVNERSHQRDVTPGAANQTVFLRGYSISVRDRPALRVLGIKRDTTFMRILALLRTKRDEIPYNNRSTRAYTSVQQFPDVSPSVSINDYILDTYYGATVALTHDHYMGLVNNVQIPLRTVELSNNFGSSTNLACITKSSGTDNAWIANQGLINTRPAGHQHDVQTLISKDLESL